MKIKAPMRMRIRPSETETNSSSATVIVRACGKLSFVFKLIRLPPHQQADAKDIQTRYLLPE